MNLSFTYIITLFASKTPANSHLLCKEACQDEHDCGWYTFDSQVMLSEGGIHLLICIIRHCRTRIATSSRTVHPLTSLAQVVSAAMSLVWSSMKEIT